jgi:hypothetical protein
MDEELLSFLIRLALAHPRAARWVFGVVAVCALVSWVNGLLPLRWRRKPIVGAIVRLADRIAHTTMRDAPGTMKLPGLASREPAQAPPLDESKGEVLK